MDKKKNLLDMKQLQFEKVTWPIYHILYLALGSITYILFHALLSAAQKDVLLSALPPLLRPQRFRLPTLCAGVCMRAWPGGLIGEVAKMVNSGEA